MKTKLQTVHADGITYDVLMFVCPGCVVGEPFDGHQGIHMLPVNSEVKKPSWTWNGDLEAPTLHPSIKTSDKPPNNFVCHSFLTDGVFQFLNDSTHSLAGHIVAIPDLPDWADDLTEDDGLDDPDQGDADDS